MVAKEKGVRQKQEKQRKQEKPEKPEKQETQKKQKKREKTVAPVEGILGRKIGMTQIFMDDGTIEPVTVLQAGPCVVIQRKTTENDGYEAVQLGFIEKVSKKKVTKPLAGHFKKAEVAPVRFIRELGILGSGSPIEPGTNVLANIFAKGDEVNITGISKGRGFQGVVRRYRFRGGKATHGSMFHRAPGSIGASSFPSRVIKGMRAPGHMGAKKATVRHLRVMDVDEKKNAIIVRGSVPGPSGGYLIIRKSTRTVETVRTE